MTEIEVTPAMSDAGLAIIDNELEYLRSTFLEKAHQMSLDALFHPGGLSLPSNRDLAERIYRAMAQAAVEVVG